MAFLVTLALAALPGAAERTNLCDRIVAVKNGSVIQDEALKGAHLSIITTEWDPRILRWDASTRQWTGLEVKLLDELSRRASFTYSLEVKDWSNVSDWDTKLFETTAQYDLVTAGYWHITPERMQKGVYSPYGFLDSTLWLVAIPEGKPPFSFEEIVSFLAPFTAWVWITFLWLMLATGLLFSYLEAAKNTEDYPEGRKGFFGFLSKTYFFDSVYKSSGHITGSSGFTPKTWPGKILIMSWTWCIVLTLAAYTANLATFLVVQTENKVSFSTVRDAVQRGKRFSVQSGTVAQAWFESRNYTDVVVASSEDITTRAKGLQGSVDFAVFPQFEYEMLKQKRAVNPSCDMTHVGLPLLSLKAGWMALNDVTEKCTKLVGDVLNVWFLRLEIESTLQEMVKGSLIPYQTCFTETSDGGDEATRLEITNMLGILCLHGVGVLLALVVHCVPKIRGQRVDAGQSDQRWAKER